MAVVPFLGLRSTDSWGASERPEDWREAILWYFPNGDVSLTALTALLGSERTYDPKFHWFEQEFPTEGGAVTGIYTNSTLATAYVGDAYGEGQMVFVKVAELLAQEFRVGMNARLCDTNRPTAEVLSKVVDRVINGASSYLACRLLEDTGTPDLDGVDQVQAAGNQNPEHATMPDAVSYSGEERTNVTQIFRNPLKISRTAMQTRYRTGDKKKDLQLQTLELHAVGIEKALLNGQYWVGAGANGMPERTTKGLINMVQDWAPANVFDFRRDAEFSGDAWAVSGDAWLDKVLSVAFTYGDGDKMAFCGNLAINGLQVLAKAGATINIVPGQMQYGIKIAEWITPYGTIMFKRHPLFTQDPTLADHMVVFEPRRLSTRFIQDTIFKPDESVSKNTNNSRDGFEEEFLTELGLEYQGIKTAVVASGFNQLNVV